MNKPNVSKIFKKVGVTLSKHSPEILTGIGIAGMVTTTVLAVKATPKALQLIEEEKAKANVEKLPPVEVVKTTWKCYVPAAVTGAVSVACLIGASSVSLKRNAALATAYKLSETALAEYQDAVIETIGEKKEKDVKDKVAEKQIEKAPINKSEVFITDKGNTLFLEPLSQRYFKSDYETIRGAVNDLTGSIYTGAFDYVSVNDFYDAIGLKHTDIGDDLGWNTFNPLKLSYSAQLLDNGEPCVVIDYDNRPKYGYDTIM